MIFDLSKIQWDYVPYPSVQELDGVQSYVREKDSPFEDDFSRPLWMTYATTKIASTNAKKWGTIAFLRRSHKFWPEFAGVVTDHLSHLFEMNLPVEGLSIVRTVGDVVPHTDEVRKCAVNIGYAKSASGLTVGWNSHTAEQIIRRYPEIPYDHSRRCRDNCAYLLDVSRVHGVIAPEDSGHRYMLSYSMMITYDQALQKLTTKKDRYEI